MWNWFTALMWEKWRRIRVPFVILCAVPLLLGLSWELLNVFEDTYGVLDMPASRDFAKMTTGFLIWDGLILILALMLIHGQRNNLQFGLDVAHFKLPVSSIKFALGQLFFGSVMIVSYIAISLSPMLLFDWYDEFVGDMIIYSLHFVLVYLMNQTLAWWIGPLSTIGAIVMLVGLGLPMATTMMIIWRECETIVAFFGAGGVFIIAPLLCIAAVHLQRTGVLSTQSLRGLFQVAIRDTCMGGDEFPSAEAAYRWYEWRRKGRVLPLVFTVIAVSNLALALISPSAFCGLWGEPWSNGFRLGNSPIAYFPFMLEQMQFLLLMCALSVGLIVPAFAYRDHVSGVATFHFTKPVPTRTLVRARGRASIRACLISAGILLVVLLPSLILWTPDPPHWAVGLGLNPGDGWNADLISGALWGITILAVLVATWTVFTLGISLLGYVVFAYLFLLLAYAVLPWPDGDAFEILESILVLISAVLAGVVTHAAWRRGLLDRTDMARFMVAWPLIAVSLLVYVSWWLEPGLGFSSLVAGILIALLAPVVTLPFALWPLIIEWQRHR